MSSGRRQTLEFDCRTQGEDVQTIPRRWHADLETDVQSVDPCRRSTSMTAGILGGEGHVGFLTVFGEGDAHRLIESVEQDCAPCLDGCNDLVLSCALGSVSITLMVSDT